MVDLSRESFRRWVQLTESQKVEAADGNVRGLVRVDTELVENVHSKANLSGHIVHADEPPERGGLNAGPSPLQYWLAGLLFCTHYHYAHNAVLMNVPIDSLKMTGRGHFDRSWVFSEARAFNDIFYEAQIQSSASEDEVKRLAEAAEKSCYVMNTVKKAIYVEGSIFLNGKKILVTQSSPSWASRSPTSP
jgi:uncharacterized OsmC-like protein